MAGERDMVYADILCDVSAKIKTRRYNTSTLTDVPLTFTKGFRLTQNANDRFGFNGDIIATILKNNQSAR